MNQAQRVPVVDIAPLGAGDEQARDGVAAAIGEACVEIGFFYVRNHGVAEDTIRRAAETMLRFFRASPHLKQSVKANANHRGWHGLGDALMRGAKRPDLKEFYQVGLELGAGDPDVVAGEPLRGPNQWPDFMPEMQADMTAYFDAVAACGRKVLEGVALSLGLKRDFFQDKYEKPLQRTQAVYYPPQPPELGPDQFGVAPHTDFGCITLLWQDDNGGLEVETPEGVWIQAPPIPGTLVFNIGDLLGRWTDGHYRSTPHRVINRSGRERLSIATFYDPSFRAVVDPREIGAGDHAAARGEAHGEATTAGDHILGRIEASFGYRKRLG